jgi:DNA-binding NarL/FixJ family response regulator
MKEALILEDMPESQEMLREVVQTAFSDVSVHCVADVASAMRLIKRVQFDLALIDLALPDGDGTTVVQAMSSRFPDCMIVVASLFDDDGHLFPALRAGAQGYILKDQTTEQLVAQLRGINDGHPPLSPSVARRLLDHFREKPGLPVAQSPLLTPREREVLIHLTRGSSVAKIGIALGISRYTVGDHVKNLYRKLKISTRAEAALQAEGLGLLQTGR